MYHQNEVFFSFFEMKAKNKNKKNCKMSELSDLHEIFSNYSLISVLYTEYIILLENVGKISLGVTFSSRFRYLVCTFLV